MPNQLTLKSDLGDKLQAASLSGSEQLGQLFSYHLRLLSNQSDLSLLPLLGSSMTATFDTDGYKRHFNGMVSEISQTGFESFSEKRQAEYAVTLVPKAWLLLHKVDCRIYLKMSVPAIVKSVLADIGYGDVRLSLSGKYDEREYCVQYRENCLNFISRLMEQEGIYYFFQHGDGVHTMVLADSLGAHAATGGYAELPYRPQTGNNKATTDAAITEFASARSVQTIKYSLTDYDPMKPKTSLLGTDSISNADGNHTVPKLDSFDYPGDHDTSDGGKHYAQVRLEAINVAQSLCTGSTNVCGVVTGALFTLAKFPRSELNKEYLVVGSTVHIENAPEVSGEQGGDQFFCHFSVIQSRQPFRSMPTATKPRVVGLQTAVVSGSDTAEDISVDKYGRIQVTFHWNKPDKENFHISCPVRVASSWAGKGWGAVNIPRVGQEVVVSFLEGDPDRPLVIGSVYNADNMPPYTLPDNKTQSGIKSRSHEGGGADDFNEIRFEDKKGSEDFFLHAQKDMHEEVENDHVVAIDHDETITIKNDQKVTIKNDQTEDITGNRKLTVGKDDKLDVTGNGTTTIGQKFKLEAGTEIQLVSGASSIVLKASGDIDIKGVKINISGDATVTAKANATMEVSCSGMTTVKGSMLSLKGDGMAQLSGGIIMIG
ncbi:type IV secretion protein Rhs [Rhodanobacter sp. B05]|uniref:type VI secretion system Vgr family protein n=1 Tax=Rhodanobacter sp. B05 TaxID=1945859 RepID=UPI0009869998|nr:type VI secretion system tip protein TssI/VgrG [Rhodanobacter sp. B05]OOG52773.1 type IV secretion protein Rhs [Rhodanobacter sp. B05]